MALNPAKTVTNPRIAKLIELEVAGRIKPEHQQELNTYRAQGLAPKDTGASLTEAQSKSTGFYNRAQGSNQEFLSAPVSAQAGPGFIGDAARSILPDNLVNSLTSSERQGAEQAKEDFIRASLRYESGAAIGQSEFDAQNKIFFPQTGDSEATIAQKALARQRVVESLRVSGGDGPAVVDKNDPAPIAPPVRSTTVSGLIDEAAGVNGPADRANVSVDIVGDAGVARSPEWRQQRSLLLQAIDNAQTPETRVAAQNALRAFVGDSETPEGAAPAPVQRGEGGIVEGLDAVVRGAADTLTFGLSDEIAAAGDTVFRGGTMAENLRRQRGVDAYDAENSPWLRGGGQLAGGLALPVLGGEATIANLARTGAAYGGAYGAGSANGGVGDRAIGALLGAGLGAGTGAGLGALASRVGRGGGGSGGGGSVPSTPARAYENAQAFGVDLPLAATGSRPAALADNTLSNLLPSAGVMQRSRAQLRDQVSGALDSVSGSYGAGRTPYNAGEAAQSGARRWLTKLDETVGKAYDAIPIAATRPSRTVETKAALGDLVDVFPTNEKLRDIFQNPTLRRYLDAFTRDQAPMYRNNIAGGGGRGANVIGTEISGGTVGWDDLKHFRSIIGEQIGQLQFGEAPLKSQLRRVYAALSDDMRQTAQAEGPRALRAFDRANTLYAAGQQRIEKALVDILGKDGNGRAEGAGNFIRSIAQSGGGGADIRKLRAIRNSMPREEWGEVSGSLIQMLGQPAQSEGREFSAQTFIRNYRDIVPEAKQLLFGDRGRQELAQRLDRFADMIEGVAGTDALRNTSNTAGQVVSGSMIGPAAIAAPGTTATSLLLANLSARLLTNKSFVQWATGFARAQKAAAGNPRQTERFVRELSRVASREPAIANDVAQLQTRLQSALGSGSAVAQEPGNKRQPQP